MLTREQYRKMQSLSKSLSGISYRGVKINRILSKDIVRVVLKIIVIRSWLIVFGLIPLKVKGDIKKANVIYSVFDQNPSMMKLVNLSVMYVPKKAEIQFQYDKIRPNMPSINNILFGIRSILNKKDIDVSIKDKIYLTIRTIFYAKYIDYCYKLIGNKKADMYISLYGGAGFVEEILNQILKNNNKDIALVSLEHGLKSSEVVTEKFINFETTAEYIFMWGMFNKDAISKINKNKQLILCGNPKYSNRKKPSKSQARKEKVITIFLDPGIGSFLKSNINLLKFMLPILKRKNIGYRLKLHPGRFGGKAEFQKSFDEALEFTDMPAEKLIVDSYACICTNSTVFVEGIFYGVPFLRYKDKNTRFLKMRPENTVFEDASGFEKFVDMLADKKKYKEISESMWDSCDYYFSFCDKDVPKTYAKTIKDIIDKKSR